jgi:quinolinate synthase
MSQGSLLFLHLLVGVVVVLLLLELLLFDLVVLSLLLLLLLQLVLFLFELSMLVQKLVQLKVRYPAAKVICHPECEPNILQHADHIGSTSSLLSYATTTPDADTFIVGTEPGILHQMQLAAPSRTFLPLPGMDETCACNECPHMRRNTLEKIRDALRDLAPRIEMPEALRLAALQPMDRMMALG